MSVAMSAWYPEPDPDGVLSEEEILAAASAADPENLPRRTSGVLTMDDSDADYGHVSGNPPTSASPMPSQRCEHVSERTRRRCRKWAVTGMRECQFHSRFGEATGVLREFVMDYARRDLYGLAPMALDVIEQIMSDDAVSPAVRLKAATETLDRIGVRGGTEVDITAEVSVSDPASEIRHRLERMAASIAPASAPAISARDAENDVVDAEIVDAPATDPAQVRAWARANGIAVSSRGRIPDSVYRRYQHRGEVSSP